MCVYVPACKVPMWCAKGLPRLPKKQEETREEGTTTKHREQTMKRCKKGHTLDGILTTNKQTPGSEGSVWVCAIRAYRWVCLIKTRYRGNFLSRPTNQPTTIDQIKRITSLLGWQIGVEEFRKQKYLQLCVRIRATIHRNHFLSTFDLHILMYCVYCSVWQWTVRATIYSL